MIDPSVGEIRMFAGNFAPRGWAFCDGQLLEIDKHMGLYALIGTTYGGDGKTTFALPNLQGRAPMHPGQGPGLTSRQLAEKGGAETVTLTEEQMPQHDHTMKASGESGEVGSLNSKAAFARSRGGELYQTEAGSNLVSLAEGTLPSAGGSQPHDNMQPFLSMNFVIALVGTLPTQ